MALLTPATQTFLSRLESSDRAQLYSLLSPSVGAATLHHIEALRSRPSDSDGGGSGGSVGGRSSDGVDHDGKEHTERATPSLVTEEPPSAAQCDASDRLDDEQTPRPSPPPQPHHPSTPSPVAAPPTAPLLTPTQLKLLLPTLLPQARRWLEVQQRGSLGQGVLHRELCELARYCLHLQQAEAKGVREREALQRLVSRQQTALLQSTKAMQAMRASRAEQQQAAEQAAAHGKRLERGLRAALRPAGLTTRDASAPHHRQHSASAAAVAPPAVMAAASVVAEPPAPPTSRVSVVTRAGAAKTRRPDGQGRPATHARAGGRQ